ncbi:hypothetical protein PDR89_14640 [Bacillus cereus group sp. Bc002]|uniref:hypothetical protein n=1 Tax=Bacillus TaxID=1386 RepID=UPI0007722058|nr:MULTISPECIES: hypothetical protein [Bacillus]KXI79567.1 hypothetical protein ACS52_09555 [Bacillus cereus]MBL3848395.1 hypothetical protein [Bacillus cereus]MCC2391786.1 hypothetical protein [Bacillus pacificus]MDA2780681.1 hypothetical protein [Bacillus cereus group sp. Bc002]MDD7782179.1 hypothetical protein [Bacillus sp. BLCC1-0148]
MQNTLTLCLVKLGELFYAGGLHRIPYDDYEFVKDEEVAFLFIDKDIAERIAKKCGGVVINKEITSHEYTQLTIKHECYIKSGKDWDLEQEKVIQKFLSN